MNKLWLMIGLLAFVASCSDKQKEAEELSTEEALEEGEQIVVQPNYDIKFEDKIYSYQIDNLVASCDKGSEIVCAIDLNSKCTINPKGQECDKSKMPKFVFMEDESLQRPTEMTFQIVKIKPLDATQIEVYTKSTCNGGWFGLCNGNVIYVLNNKDGQWVVKDIYARDSF